MKYTGKNFEVLIDGVRIGDATECVLTTSESLIDSTTKDDNNYTERNPSLREWSVDTSVIFDEANTFDVVDIIDLIINATKVTVRFQLNDEAGIIWQGDAFAVTGAVTAALADMTGSSVTFQGDGGLSKIVLGDWFLPSVDEMAAMDTEGSTAFTTSSYWTSSEVSATNAYYFNVGSGAEFSITKSQSLIKVWPCRIVTASDGTFSVGDTGLGGGVIFYADGTTFYEAYTDDFSPAFWSNVTGTAIGTTGTAIGTGLQNTLDIIGQAGHTSSAASICNDLN